MYARKMRIGSDRLAILPDSRRSISLARVFVRQQLMHLRGLWSGQRQRAHRLTGKVGIGAEGRIEDLRVTGVRLPQLREDGRGFFQIAAFGVEPDEFQA